MESYDYTHRDGVLDLGWDAFAALAGRLAEALAGEGIDTVVGVARAGLFPATAVACALRRDLVPVRVSRRVDDRVVHRSPAWRVPIPPDAVAGKVVAVVDEIADTGETLRLVAADARRLGAARVVTAALVAHSWADPRPDVVALESDALVLFPWDRRVFTDGRWQPHPELADALALQGIDAAPDRPRG